MPTYSWWAKTIDRSQKAYDLSGTFHLETHSIRDAEMKVLDLAHEWHDGAYIVVQMFDLELIENDRPGLTVCRASSISKRGEEIMHRLEDMRVIENAWAVTLFICRVDADGHMTTIEREVTVDNAIHQTWPPTGTNSYQCAACGQEFSTWDEARLHVTDLNQ